MSTGAEPNLIHLVSITWYAGAGRPARHAELNGVVKTSLQTSGVLCLPEPPGLSRDHGRKLDGITMFAYKHALV